MANGQNVNYSLRFNADVSQAKQQLNSLQDTLTKLINSAGKDSGRLGITNDINESVQAAAQLKVKLQEATNVKTGQLDLNKFTTSLRKSNIQISDVQKSLANLGPAGNQAFNELAKSIMNAEMPLKQTNALVERLKTSLTNAVMWQISSTAIHGFLGTIQQAMGYAKDLNESLTNIQIVTGNSTQQMAKFAIEANKAAQSLSTTTTKYTDAALIFYQQGLDTAQVKERTDLTIKMSQATGDAAKDVSSYMTAIWNNFAQAGDSLERFADIITALGASTASSSSEIAQGLSQFAPIAETVGLSYEYATSALATLVSATRQSADLVGNSLKTIFSRLQGLKLGESLEDGTDLNKYSAALAAVGVQVKDSAGNLRAMDQILDDLAGKWNNLTNAQQMALAQTVAGKQKSFVLTLVLA